MSITPTTADSIPMTTRKFRESRETYMQRKAVITEIFRTKSIFPTEQETDAIMVSGWIRERCFQIQDHFKDFFINF